MSIRVTIESMVRFRVGKEERIRFWLETCVGKAPLASQFPFFLCNSDGSVMVKDCFSKNGGRVVWCPVLRRNLVEGEIEEFVPLLSVLDSVYIADQGKDKRVWMGTVEGAFSLASFFLVMRGDSSSLIAFDNVWKSKALPRVPAFAWLAIFELSLPITMDNLCKCNITIVNGCPMCLWDVESQNQWTTYFFIVRWLVYCGLRFYCGLMSAGFCKIQRKLCIKLGWLGLVLIEEG